MGARENSARKMYKFQCLQCKKDSEEENKTKKSLFINFPSIIVVFVWSVVGLTSLPQAYKSGKRRRVKRAYMRKVQILKLFPGFEPTNHDDDYLDTYICTHLFSLSSIFFCKHCQKF